jgi:hypothetical protein
MADTYATTTRIGTHESGGQEPELPEKISTEVADAIARVDEHDLRAAIDFA